MSNYPEHAAAQPDPEGDPTPFEVADETPYPSVRQLDYAAAKENAGLDAAAKVVNRFLLRQAEPVTEALLDEVDACSARIDTNDFDSNALRGVRALGHIAFANLYAWGAADLTGPPTRDPYLEAAIHHNAAAIADVRYLRERSVSPFADSQGIERTLWLRCAALDRQRGDMPAARLDAAQADRLHPTLPPLAARLGRFLFR